MVDLLKRKPKDLDASSIEEHDAVGEGGVIAENEATAKRQRMILFGGGGVIALLSVWWIMGDTKATVEKAGLNEKKTIVSTDAIMNRQVADQQWMANYEHQINENERRLEGVEADRGRMQQLEAELQALRGENQAMVSDGTRVLDAYERENQQLKRQLEDARARPSAPGPVRSAAALGVPSGGSVAPSSVQAPRSNSVKLTAFSESSGTAARIDASKGATTFTDSANYLPPNSIAKATVVVGVDATTNTRSQSDPLPVLLRVTGPARSVFHDGKLLATKVQGCMVNGAAYGDLSSEKVYVKLQRMTCPQPGGRYAVSEVKGFLAFGGKVGIRGRVVSREGSLTTQAFLSGLVSGGGNALNGSLNLPVQSLQTDPDGKLDRNPSLGNVALRALGGGAAQAGTTLSEYLIERAEQYQPVIEMPTGASVEVVFLDGTFIRN